MNIEHNLTLDETNGLIALLGNQPTSSGAWPLLTKLREQAEDSVKLAQQAQLDSYVLDAVASDRAEREKRASPETDSPLAFDPLASEDRRSEYHNYLLKELRRGEEWAGSPVLNELEAEALIQRRDPPTHDRHPTHYDPLGQRLKRIEPTTAPAGFVSRSPTFDHLDKLTGIELIAFHNQAGRMPDEVETQRIIEAREPDTAPRMDLGAGTDMLDVLASEAIAWPTESVTTAQAVEPEEPWDGMGDVEPPRADAQRIDVV